MEKKKKKKKKNNNNNNNSSNSLVFGRWPQTKMLKMWKTDSASIVIGAVDNHQIE